MIQCAKTPLTPEVQEMVRWALNPKTAAFIIIDMSNDFIKPGALLEIPEGRAMIPRLNRLAQACRAKGIPIIYTTHAHQPDGSDLGLMGDVFSNVRDGRVLRAGAEGVKIYQEIAPQPGDHLLVKSRYSAFQSTNLEAILRNKGVDTLIIGGVATNVCCESTAREAFFKDFRVIFLSDGNAASDLPDRGWGKIPREEIQRHVLTTLAWGFAQVASVDQVLAELGEK